MHSWSCATCSVSSSWLAVTLRHCNLQCGDNELLPFAGILVFGALLYAKLFSIPILVSYHTHIPQYIPQYTWAGLVEPMWKLIRFCVRAADVTLVVSSQSKVHL